MSVQVSYKKQTLFGIILLLCILVVFEMGVRVYEYINPECFYLNSDATKNLPYELRVTICEQSESVKILQAPVYQYVPNQKLDTININSHGFRGEDFNLEKNENKYRIMMVGGSTTFGSGSTSDNATIPAFLENEFKTNMYDVEVINAGVGAADSREEAYKIKNIFKKFDPDLFIIYDGWNDSTKIQKEEEIDPNISRTEEKDEKKSDIQKFIRDYMQEYRTVFVIYPLIQDYFFSLNFNDNVYQKNAEIWSSRWEEVCYDNKQDEIKTIVLLQPIVGSGQKQLSLDEKRHADYIKHVKIREQLEYFANSFPIQSCDASIDLRNELDEIKEPIFYDGGHMIDKGNEIIAKSIFQKIKPIIENDLYEYQY
tara:strand:+ start:1379 stop:2485 length:1107 start_codon:yes stop_codon:yes gene_type:complete